MPSVTELTFDLTGFATKQTRRFYELLSQTPPWLTVKELYYIAPSPSFSLELAAKIPCLES